MTTKHRLLSRKLASLWALMFFVQTTLCQGSSDCESNLVAGCDENSLSAANIDVCLPQRHVIFGIEVRGTSTVPTTFFDYAVNVMAEYLDSDNDGIPDDVNLVYAMTNSGQYDANKVGMVAVVKCSGEIGRGALKDSFLGIARSYLQTDLNASPNWYKRNVLEEFHHAIAIGYAYAYPAVFNPNDPLSEIYRATEALYGNCEDVATCVMSAGGCTNYNCNCQASGGTCTDAGEYQCTFISGSCDGAYHYATPSCQKGGCLEGEGLYHGWMAQYRYECDGNAAEIVSEWELCAYDDWSTDARAEMMRNLITGQSASAAEYGYTLPTVLPDGVYSATEADPSLWPPVAINQEPNNEPVAACFSSMATTIVKNQGETFIKDIQIGDDVLTGSGTFKKVYTIDHKNPSATTKFVQVHYKIIEGNDKIRAGPLEITPGHMLYVVGKKNPIPAHKIKVDDQVHVLYVNDVGRSSNIRTAAKPGFGTVTKVAEVTRDGLWNVITTDGQLVVDGIVTSTYSITFGEEENINIAGYKIMSYHDFIHMLIAPYRAFCTSTGASVCDVNAHDKDGFNVYSRFGTTVVNFANQQNQCIRSGMVLGIIVIFGIPYALMNNHILLFLFAMVGGIMVWSFCNNGKKSKVLN